MKKFIKELLRAVCGYKYIIVYTQIKTSPKRTHRYMVKMLVDDNSNLILTGLPDFANNGYMPPVILWYSKNDKNLYNRKQLGQNANVRAVYIENFK